MYDTYQVDDRVIACFVVAQSKAFLFLTYTRYVESSAAVIGSKKQYKDHVQFPISVNTPCTNYYICLLLFVISVYTAGDSIHRNPSGESV